MRWLLGNEAALLVTILIGNNLALELATVGEALIADIAGLTELGALALAVALTLTPLVFLFGEALPRTSSPATAALPGSRRRSSPSPGSCSGPSSGCLAAPLPRAALGLVLRWSRPARPARGRARVPRRGAPARRAPGRRAAREQRPPSSRRRRGGGHGALGRCRGAPAGAVGGRAPGGPRGGAPLAPARAPRGGGRRLLRRTSSATSISSRCSMTSPGTSGAAADRWRGSARCPGSSEASPWSEPWEFHASGRRIAWWWRPGRGRAAGAPGRLLGLVSVSDLLERISGEVVA